MFAVDRYSLVAETALDRCILVAEFAVETGFLVAEFTSDSGLIVADIALVTCFIITYASGRCDAIRLRFKSVASCTNRSKRYRNLLASCKVSYGKGSAARS